MSRDSSWTDYIGRPGHGNVSHHLRGDRSCRGESVSDGQYRAEVRNIRGDSNLVLCLLLGVQSSSPLLFERHLLVLLRHVERAFTAELASKVELAAKVGPAFKVENVAHRDVAKAALLQAMNLYSPGEKIALGEAILETVDTILRESVSADGVWCCFIVQNLPIVSGKLRQDPADPRPSKRRCEGSIPERATGSGFLHLCRGVLRLVIIRRGPRCARRFLYSLHGMRPASFQHDKVLSSCWDAQRV